MAERETRFTKIKFDGARVRIEYEVTRKDGGAPDEYLLTSIDAPAPEFRDALMAMRQDVIEICELDPSCGDKLTVRGVSISHTNDIRGCCVTALKALKTANAPLVLNTPHLPSSSYSGEDNGEPLMSGSMCERLDALEVQAQRYVDGERAQADLFATAAALDAAAELGSLAGDDVSSVTLSAPGIEPITFDASTAPVHRAKARQLRELAAQ